MVRFLDIFRYRGSGKNEQSVIGDQKTFSHQVTARIQILDLYLEFEILVRRS